MMSRPVTPCRSVTTEESLIAADSSSFSARFFSRVRSSGQVPPVAGVQPDHPELGVATKHGVTAPRSKHAASHRESPGSCLGRPGRCLTCRRRPARSRTPRPPAGRTALSSSRRLPPSRPRAPASTAVGSAGIAGACLSPTGWVAPQALSHRATPAWQALALGVLRDHLGHYPSYHRLRCEDRNRLVNRHCRADCRRGLGAARDGWPRGRRPSALLLVQLVISPGVVA